MYQYLDHMEVYTKLFCGSTNDNLVHNCINVYIKVWDYWNAGKSEIPLGKKNSLMGKVPQRESVTVQTKIKFVNITPY